MTKRFINQGLKGLFLSINADKVSLSVSWGESTKLSFPVRLDLEEVDSPGMCVLGMPTMTCTRKLIAIESM